MKHEPNIYWPSVRAAQRRIDLANARLHSWPYNRHQLSYALKNLREAQHHLETALAGKRRR